MGSANPLNWHAAGSWNDAQRDHAGCYARPDLKDWCKGRLINIESCAKFGGFAEISRSSMKHAVYQMSVLQTSRNSS